MISLDSTPASTGHTAYVAEARSLVHDQVDALFALLMTTVEHLGASGAVTPRPIVTRGDSMLRITIGRCSATLEVRAAIDVPNGESRAQFFPFGPARCIVHASSGILAQWDLRQVRPGDASLVRAWMVAETENVVTESDAVQVMDYLSACQSAGDRLSAAVPA
jgi:hypothetical protein